MIGSHVTLLLFQLSYCVQEKLKRHTVQVTLPSSRNLFGYCVSAAQFLHLLVFFTNRQKNTSIEYKIVFLS